MKKFVGLLALIGLFIGASQAGAITLGIYDTGALVPFVKHDGAQKDTVVGITCQAVCSENLSDHDGKTKYHIHWTFYDIDSVHITDGTLICTDDDLVPFSWKASSGRNLDNVEGYLVFNAGDNVTIGANAFFVDQGANDVIFVPVVPLNTADLGGLAADGGWDPDQVISLTNGIRANRLVDVRYWIDSQYNAATTMIIWLVDPFCKDSSTPAKCAASAFPITVNAWNDDEKAKSINILLPHELNKIIPCEIPGLPEDFIDGFFTVPMPYDGIAYSYISSNWFGAMQTLLGMECEVQDHGNPPQEGCSRCTDVTE